MPVKAGNDNKFDTNGAEPLTPDVKVILLHDTVSELCATPVDVELGKNTYMVGKVLAAMLTSKTKVVSVGALTILGKVGVFMFTNEVPAHVDG